jgi:hypothetical protein
MALMELLTAHGEDGTNVAHQPGAVHREDDVQLLPLNIMD